ncbi:hypothetical protein [Coleofasciculus sp. E2-BRE-01]|uniref:hypothetical protein n=1 Tax=Coleofasciculus sp. E2-BRE-01 TaxID=3069524 RepID=UPI0033050525
MEQSNRIIRLKETTNPYGGGEMVSEQTFLNNLSQRHPELGSEWFTEGVEVESLLPGGQWQKGKLLISLSFVQESPAPANSPAAPNPNTSTIK